ncbi:MAG TPA: response regulator transcription factor [Dehalococcoidia bacterium]|nr:response regulator transcription factor [Dehalococcoidia bacterium]
MNKPQVLVVDDDHKNLRLLRIELTAQGFGVSMAERGDEALQAVQRLRPDLVVLDIIMPGMDGLTVLKRLRETSGVPVILLTAKGTDSDKILGLELGADDYIPKPFNPEELTARARAVLRRSQAREAPATGNRLQCGNIVIDLARRTVFVGGKPVVLSRTEWQLLQQLCANAGRVMLHEDLLTRTWGPEYREDLQYLRVWISRLRQKLEANPAEPRYIRTVQGIGYILEADGEEQPHRDGSETSVAS